MYQLNPSISALKGLLVLLLMVSHLFNREATDNPWNWQLSAVHLPLLIAVSGFVFERATVRGYRFGQFFLGCLSKILLPWIVAVAAYAFVRLPHLSPDERIMAALAPEYDLWYPPLLFLCLATVFVTNLSRAVLFWLSVAVYACTALFVAAPLLKEPVLSTFTRQLGCGFDGRMLLFPCFYFAGAFASRKSSKFMDDKVPLVLRIAGLVSTVAWAFVYYQRVPVVVFGVFTALNASLIFLLPQFFQNNDASLGLLQRIGENSIFYIVWHPILYIAAKAFLYPAVPESAAFVATFVGSLALLVGVDYLANDRTGARLLGLMDRTPWGIDILF